MKNVLKKGVDSKLALRIYAYTLGVILLLAGTVYAGTEVGSFTAPLLATLGGTGQTSYAIGDILYAPTTTTVGKLADVATGSVLASGGVSTAPSYTASPSLSNLTLSTNLTMSANTAKSFIYSDASSNVVATSAPTNGQLLIGSTGAIPAVASLTQGTGITVTNGAGTITIAATGGGSRTVSTKTTNYSVLSGDSGTFFDNTGAGGSVNFTLPTAAAGLWYTFYTDAVQTVTVTAGASTTIQLGGSTSASAGNVTNAVKGNSITVIGIDTTHWVTYSYTGTWTVN